jgi:hypothetical protein
MSKETNNSDWQCFLCEGWNRNRSFTNKCNWCKSDKNDSFHRNISKKSKK